MDCVVRSASSALVMVATSSIRWRMTCGSNWLPPLHSSVVREDDPAHEWDLVALEVVGVSVAVPAFVLGADDRCEVREAVDGREQFCADDSVKIETEPSKHGST